MAYTRITAAEAEAMIKNGENIGLSGFTPAGTAKAVTKELAKIAQAEHEAGREFKVGLFTGASTGQSTDGDLSNAQAIKYRAPYTTNSDFRKHVNAGEIAYNDIHLSHMAQELRYGFMGEVDWAIIEVCDIEEGADTCKAYLTAAGGISLQWHAWQSTWCWSLTDSTAPRQNICTTYTSRSTRRADSRYLSHT